MRAIAVDQYKGEPRLVDIAQPAPKPNQLLVRIAATALNPFDWKVADGIMEGAMPAVFPLVLGQDAAGTIAAVGSKVTRFKPGERIFGQFFHSPVGEGTFAEYAVVSETGTVAALPADISFETAAALPTAGMTALSLVETLDLEPGALLLVVGATGGVGSFVTQLAAAGKLRVLATAGAADTERVRNLGAAEIYQSRNAALIEEVKRNHPQGIDGLIDLVSDAAGLTAMLDLLRAGGRVLTTVFAADEKALGARGLGGGNFEVKGNSALLTRLSELVATGKVVVPIEHTIALEEAPDAIERSRAGHSKGKTVIRVS